MMECTTCDKEFEYGYIFCPYCGIELVEYIGLYIEYTDKKE